MLHTWIACCRTLPRATTSHATSYKRSVPRAMRQFSRVLCCLPIGILIAAAAAGCGKRGNPQAPLRPVPAAVGGLTARRTGDRVELRFTIPAENTDHSTPPALTRVDIYAAAGPPSAVPPVSATIPAAFLSMP